MVVNRVPKPEIHLLNPHSPAATSDASDKSPGDGFLKTALAIISLVGIALTLIGYGVALAKADKFGLEVTDICRSPVEFLVASSDFILALFENLDKFTERGFAPRELILVEGFGLGIVLVIVYSLYRGLLNTRRKRIALGSRARTLATPMGSFIEKFHLKYFFVAGVGALVPWAAFWFFSALIIFSLVAVAILPILGFTAGEALVMKYIISPTRCHQYIKARPSPKSTFGEVGAVCVRVLNKDGNEIARGRRIARNSEQLFLYYKESGKVMSIPVRDLIVEQVESETAEKLAKE